MNIKRRIFDVHIIESNKDSEPEAEGKALAAVLTISDICAHEYVVRSRDQLRDTLLEISEHKRCLHNHHRRFLPFFHFAMHASPTGIYLCGEELVTWDDMLKLLSPLRQKLQGNLLICMSACHGFYGYKLACSFERFTYYFLVGTRESLKWQDTILAYHIFYHSLFFRHAKLHDAVKAMNINSLSRRYSFDYTYGSEVQGLCKRHFYSR
jgi:hypothetical protein